MSGTIHVDTPISRCVFCCLKTRSLRGTHEPLIAFSEETDMAKKSARKLSSALLFKKEWIFDPGPEWFRINRAATTRVNQLKNDFTKRVNNAIRQGQQ